MSTAPSNLNCILLNACGAAYNVKPGTNVWTPDTIYSPNVPYTAPPKVAFGEKASSTWPRSGRVHSAS